MIDRERSRQISCVVKKIITLMEMKVKGSLTIHFSGDGTIGNTFDERIKRMRDYPDGNKKGTPIDENEFFNLLRGNN